MGDFFFAEKKYLFQKDIEIFFTFAVFKVNFAFIFRGVAQSG